MIANDAKSVCVFIKHDNDLSRDKSDELVKIIRSKIKQFTFDDVHLAGTSVGQQYYIQKMNYFIYMSIMRRMVQMLWVIRRHR